jgi:MSHA pilin protein MshA
MKKMQSGFTLIELVMVIVILGILAASALPKFVNLSDDAAQAAAKGVLGGTRSAAVIDQAQYYLSSGTGLIATDADLFAAMDSTPSGCVLGAADTTFICTFGGTAYTYSLSAATAAGAAQVVVSGQSW